LTLKKVWKDGTRAVLLEPDDLLVRLCAAVPAPRMHLLLTAPERGAAFCAAVSFRAATR